MTLRTHLAALERASHRLGGFGTCPTCGGPSPGMDPFVIADRRKSAADHEGPAQALYLERRCPECSLLIDELGRAFSDAEPSRLDVRESITMRAN